MKPGQSIGAVSKDLGLIEQTLRNRVKAADAGKLNGAGGKVVTVSAKYVPHFKAGKELKEKMDGNNL